MAEKRINQLSEATELKQGMYIPVDHETDGTQKMTPSTLLGEVEDIRTGHDGTTYPSAGDAVRGQVSDLKSTFTKINNEVHELVDNYINMDLSNYPRDHGYLGENGVFTPTTGSNTQWTTQAIYLPKGTYEATFDGLNGSSPTYVRAIAVYNNQDVCTWFSSSLGTKYFSISESESYVRVNTQYTDVTSYVLKSVGEERIKASVLPSKSNYMPCRRPVIGFIFDGDYNRNKKFKELFDSHNKKCGYALPYTLTFAYATKEDLLLWQAQGFEILAHSAVAVGTQSTATDVEIAQIVKDSYNTLSNYGFNIHGFVAYQGNAKPIAIETAQQIFEYGATALNHTGSNTVPVALNESNLYVSSDAPYKLWRYSMQSSTLQQMKDAVDRCVDTNGMVLFYGHANSSALENMTLDNIDELLTYIESKGVDVKTPYEAIKDYYSIRWQDVFATEQRTL